MTYTNQKANHILTKSLLIGIIVLAGHTVFSVTTHFIGQVGKR